MLRMENQPILRFFTGREKKETTLYDRFDLPTIDYGAS